MAPQDDQPIRLKWIIAAGALVGLLASLFPPSGGRTTDGSVLSAAEHADILREYPDVPFSLLAGFTYASRPTDAAPDDSWRRRVPPPVLRYSGQKVSVEGFMLPIEGTEAGISRFLLTASFDMCAYGAPTRPNDFIVVTMKDGRLAPFIHTPIVAFGVLTVQEQQRNGRVASLYQMESDGVSVHGAR